MIGEGVPTSRRDSWKAAVAARLRPYVDRWSDDPRVRLEREVFEHGLNDVSGWKRSDVRDLEEVFARFTDRRASYMHALDETKRHHALLSTLGVRHPYWDINMKAPGYRFAASLGIDTPREIARFERIEDVDPDDLPDRFLLKPMSGAANRGVIGLDRQADGTYIDRLLGRTLTWEDVRAEYHVHLTGAKISAGLIVEELLCKPRDPTSIPDDFKVYCFYDRAALVMQRDLRQKEDRKEWRFKFWNREWDDVGPVKFADRCDPDLAPPAHGREIIDAAERIGKRLRLPFIRLDFYDADRGVVFGELSLSPGAPEVFDPDVDEHLGRHRELAAARIAAEDIKNGYWDHLRLPDDPERATFVVRGGPSGG